VSPDPASQTGAPDPGASGPGATASEEERARAAYEAELSRISSSDMMLQAAVSLLNIGARRLTPAEGQAAAARSGGSQADAGAAGTGATAERDLDQVRDSIDAVRALLEILERRVPEGLRPLRDALAQLQLAYAREVEAERAAPGQPGQRPDESGARPEPARSGAEEERAGGAQEEQAGESPSEGERRGPGPAEASGRLWVPGR
jgi:hypothetical protein